MFGTALLALALSTHAATAQETTSVVLKEQLVSVDGIITLSDLFDNAGAAGAIQLARAPSPGQTLSLDPAYVQQTAAREGLHWANAAGLLRVTVERAARTVASDALTAMIEEVLYMETGRPHAVALSNMRQSLHAPLDTVGGPELLQFDHDTRSHIFRAEIAPYPGGAPITLSGRAQPVTDVPVLRRTIARGQTITAADVDWVRLPESQLRGEIVLSAQEMIGMAARRALMADQPLRSFDIEPPTMIHRGETVSLIYRVGALTLTAQARALEDAGQGQTIRFVNLQSNRTVEARVDAPGAASVVGGGMRRAS